MTKTSKSPASRSNVILKSGLLFIFTNFLLALFNVIVGLLSGSIAIMSDAAHSLIDAISGLLIIVSEKLASYHKLSSYRAKIERATTIIIAIIIIFVGAHIIIESFEKIFAPESPDYTAPTIIVLIASIIAKYSLAIYLRRRGLTYHSSVLTASGAETLNDTWISVAVLASAIIYLIWHWDIEAYIGLVIAVVIIKVGLEFIFPHLSHHHHHHFEQDPDHDHCQSQHS